MAETESETKAPELYAELNIFSRSPQGFDSHIKVMVPQKEAASYLLALSESLAAKQFTASQRYGSNGASGNGAGAAQDARQPRPAHVHANTPAPVCNYCEGAVYDNRGNKRNPRGPDFTCKNKEGCGGRAWIGADGTLRWTDEPPA